MKGWEQTSQGCVGSFDGQPPNLGRRWRLHLYRAVQALGAGGSTIPFGDNGDVFRALAEARKQESRGATCC